MRSATYVPCPEVVLLLYMVHMCIPFLLVMIILIWRRLNSASQMVQNWKAAAPNALKLDPSTSGSNLAEAIGREALAASGMQKFFGELNGVASDEADDKQISGTTDRR